MKLNYYLWYSPSGAPRTATKSNGHKNDTLKNDSRRVYRQLGNLLDFSAQETALPSGVCSKKLE